MNYRVYGLSLASDIPLPELQPTDDPATIVFALGEGDVNRDGWRWLPVRQTTDGSPWLALGAREGAYLLGFAGGVEFVIAAGGRIEAHARPEAPMHTVRHLLIDQVLPQWLSHTGRLVLHASAVQGPLGAVAFLGRTGTGKSTLAASFAASGSPLLADDAVVVERRGGRAFAVVAYPGVRVWPDVLAALGEVDDSARVAHYTAKCRLGPVNSGLAFAAGPLPLRRLYVLDPATGDAPAAITPLSKREQVIELVKNTYVMDLTDRARLTAQLDRAIVEGGPVDVRRLQYPHAADALPLVRRAILADLDRS